MRKIYDGYNEAWANERQNELEKYGYKTKKVKKGERIKIYRI